MNVISQYTVQDAEADGVLTRLWSDDEAAFDKPVYATIGIMSDLESLERQKIMGAYRTWLKYLKDALPEEDRMFACEAVNGKRVWVLDDGVTIVMMYPHEY
jgi:hypothetical protein